MLKLKPLILYRIFFKKLTSFIILPVHQLFDIRVNTCKLIKKSLSSSTYSPYADAKGMDVIKSANDKREYRVVNLDNGLTALLISDPASKEDEKEKVSESESESDGDEGEEEEPEAPECKKKKKSPTATKKSAAALCIGVGSFCDPSDILGFAHFLEHMVFMGSKKYPKENDMDDFLGKHGGESNAWTDCEKTNFYFDVQKKYFHKALDKFAHFFVCPLMLKDSVDREIQAVDSEFQMSLTNDSDRLNQLLSTTAVPLHPMGRFMCGNLKTLKIDPERNGIDVHDRLRGFYERNYSSHYMTLAVHSQESLDDLHKLVTETFADISNNNLAKPSFKDLKNPFETQEFRKFFKVIPMEDSHSVEITWSLPTQLENFQEKPLEYLTSLIMDEGKGSILSYLKKKLWALEISGGSGGYGFDHNSTWASFSVSITLTESGLDQIFEVLTVLFKYIFMLQRAGPQPRIFRELQQIEDSRFRWKEQGEPMDYVECIAECMQLFPPAQYLIGKRLFLKYNEKLIQECTDMLKPELANIVVLSKHFENQGICNLVEPWYGTKYCVTDVDPEWLNKWKNLETMPELQLPEPNPYIATKFDLVNMNNPGKFPYKLIDKKNCRIWFKKDSKFNVPKGYIFINLMSSAVSESVENATLMDLYINVLLYTLNEAIYPSVTAGYEYCVEGFNTGVVIQMTGFNHKLPVLFNTIVDYVADFTCSSDIFQAVSKQLKKNYYNQMITPYQLAKTLRFALLEPDNKPVFDRYQIVSSLTEDMLKDFVNKYKQSIFIEGFVIGNFSPDKVTEMGNYIMSKLPSNVTSDQMPKKFLLAVPPGKMCCRVLGLNETDNNCCVTNYYQSVPGTLRDCCLNELLVTRMQEPCFDKLRTKYQLGYSVFCRSSITNGILGLQVTVQSQSSKFSLKHVDGKMSEFLRDFKILLANMKESEFNTLVKSLINEKQEEDTQMGEEADRCWNQIQDHFYVFDVLQKEVAILKTLTLNDLRKWYDQFVGNREKKLSLQVQGASGDAKSESTKTDNSHTVLTFLTDNDQNTQFVTNIEDVKKDLKLLPYTLITS